MEIVTIKPPSVNPSHPPLAPSESGRSNGLSALDIKARAVAAFPVTAETMRGDVEADLQITEVKRLGMTLGELLEAPLPPRVEIIRGLARSENGSLLATTDTGKTTYIRNVALAVACGRRFLPLVETGVPRKVVYMDFEDTPVFARDDFRVMLKRLSPAEARMVKDNLYFYCEVQIGEEELRLSNPDHFMKVANDCMEFNPDLIVVDTTGKGFAVSNENDNAEVIEKIMRPLNRLAKITEAAVIGLHHIGKAKAEDGASREPAHRGRGASSYADQSRVIFNLERDTANETVLLTCAKIKGPKFPNHVLKLRPEERWFDVTEGAPIVTVYERLLDLFRSGESLKTDQVIIKMKPVAGKSSVKANLADAINNGDLMQPRHGYYQAMPCLLSNLESPQSPEGIRDGLCGLSKEVSA